jgi:hypothetical protein
MSAVFSFQAYVYRGRGEPLGRTLEQVVSSMGALEGLFFEWDGSLTWANQSEGWQIDATVYDNADEIQYVDMHARVERSEQIGFLRDRLGELLATWGPREDLMLLRLPDRRWQNLQDFEKELVGETH